jgi:GNAT superfamily N-acetyltransferase
MPTLGIEDPNLMVSLSMRADLHTPTNDSPGLALVAHEGEIRAFVDDDEQEVGKWCAYVLRSDWLDGLDASPSDALDAVSASTAEYMVMYDRNIAGFFSRRVERLFEELESCSNNNLLIIDRVEIYSEYQGRGIGLAAMQLITRHLGEPCALAAIKPYPLQFESGNESLSLSSPAQMGLDTFTKDKRLATAKLRAHYAQLGFVTLPRTKLMIKNLYALDA